MARILSRKEVLDLVLDDDCFDEHDSEDDFDGYIDDGEIERITRHNEYEYDEGNEGGNEKEKECENYEDENETNEGDNEYEAVELDEEEDNDNSNIESNESDDLILPNYSAYPGGRVDMTNKKPVDFFDLLITDDIIEKIVDETNLYANQFLENNGELPRYSRVHVWKKKAFCAGELLKFLGIILCMGLIRYPKLEDYWSTTWPFHIRTFSDVISRDRFSVILKFFHLNDNSNFIPKGSPGYDPLYKLRPLLEPLLRNFRCNFILGKELSVDEQMVSYKGRLSFLQYIPKKPTRWGMKAFVLADSHYGYIYNWKLYTGKDESLDITTYTKVTHAVVMKVIKGLELKGHHVYMDNYYSSPNLFHDLHEKGFGACGTVSVNRMGMPKEWQKKKTCKRTKEDNIIKELPPLKKGEVRIKNLKGNLKALQWKDKRVVTMISTIHDDTMIHKTRRRKLANGGREEVMKPVMVEEYNRHMGGVDKADQMLSYYSFSHRTIKWWKRAAFHLIEVAVVNSYILYKLSDQSGRYLTQKEYITELARELVERGGHLQSTSQSQLCVESPIRLTDRHFPSKIEDRTTGKPHQKDCCVCSKRQTFGRKTTTYKCKQCDVPLCVVPCFELYHTYKDPKRHL